MGRLGTILYDRLVLVDEAGAVVSTEDGAALRYGRDDVVFERFDGKERRAPRAHTIEMDTSDGELLDAVEAARLRSGTLRLFAEGRDRHTLWSAPVLPAVLPLEGQTGGPALKRVRFFTGEGTAEVADAVANLLSVFGWRGRTSLPAAYNLVAQPGTETLATTGVLTFAMTGGDTLSMTCDVLAPAPGTTAHASVLVTASDLGGADTADLTVAALNAGGGVITSASTGVQLAGTYAASLVLPSGTVSVRWRLDIDTASLVDRTVSLSTPCVRLGDTSTPVYY